MEDLHSHSTFNIPRSTALHSRDSYYENSRQSSIINQALETPHNAELLIESEPQSNFQTDRDFAQSVSDNLQVQSDQQNQDYETRKEIQRKFVYEVRQETEIVPTYNYFKFQIDKLENPKGKLVSFLVSGNQSSESSFNLITQEYFRDASCFQILGIYICDEKNNSNFNYANAKETVLSLYSSKFIGTEHLNNFIYDLKVTESGFDEALYLATGNKSDFFAIGYDSLKGPTGYNKYQEMNIDILLSRSAIPIMLIKENTPRKAKKNKGYNWFILFDHSYINCFKAFITFSELIDKENDFVFGFGSYPSYITFDVYQKQFIEFCEENGIQNYAYESDSYVKKVSEAALERVNYSTTHYDFIVFYNNADRHSKDKENSQSLRILRKAQANVCFINNIYI